jgi:uncharacterized protein YecE (DUF72 family)
MAIRIGTSGFIYEHWRRRFYPPSARGSELELYARTFDTVELNVTFYRMPPASTFRSWAARVPEGFLFAVKASRYLTHVRRLREPRPSVELLVDRASELGPHLGPILIQLPPDLELDLAALEEALDAFPAGIRIAVEPRHASWFVEDVRRALTERNVALCVADRRGPISPLWRTADWTYLRFHAGRAKPRSCYGAGELETWAERLETGWGPEATGFVYFNNDGNGCALRDSSVFAALLDRRGVDVASLPSVPQDVVLDPGVFVADIEGRAPAALDRVWGRVGGASRRAAQGAQRAEPGATTRAGRSPRSRSRSL